MVRRGQEILQRFSEQFRYLIMATIKEAQRRFKRGAKFISTTGFASESTGQFIQENDGTIRVATGDMAIVYDGITSDWGIPIESHYQKFVNDINTELHEE